MKIFINYRREDSGNIAFNIATSLMARFGSDKVFFDNQGIKVGKNFREQIKAAFEGCKIFIPIIGKEWSNIMKHRKGISEEDFVLEEILLALQIREVVVIPILLDDTPMPSKNDLPKEFHDFLYVQAFVMSSNPNRLHRDLSALNEFVNKELELVNNPETSNRIPIPIPERLISHFKDRENEISNLYEWIIDKNFKMIQICGRGGTGKTSLVLKAILEIKNNNTKFGEYHGIIFISFDELCYRTPDRIIELISATLNSEKATQIRDIWKQSGTSLHDRLALLFRGPLINHQCLIILDNLESILDDENKIHKDYNPISKFIESILEYDHLIKLIVTSRKELMLSPDIAFVAAEKSIQIDLDKGLPEEFAISLLRELDYNGQGIRNAKEEILQDIVKQCSNIPRTLESIVATLMQKPTWTFDILINNKEYFNDLIQNPARELFESLSTEPERLVVTVLAIYGKPVSRDAICHMLPKLHIDELLDNLFHKFVIKFDHGLFWLHSIDKEYIYSQIPERGTIYSRQVLHKLAADYYRNIPCLPMGIRKSLEDSAPILDAINQLILADLADEATELFFDRELGEDLYWWGYFYLLKDICQRFLELNVSSKWKIKLQIYLGKIQRNIGNLEEAKKTYENALSDINDSVDIKSKVSLYIAMGDINYYLGDYNLSYSYHQKADQFLKGISEPLLQSENAGDTGNLMLSTGKINEAQELYEQAIIFSRKAKNKIFEGIWNGNLGNLYMSLFNSSLDIHDQERAIFYLLNAINISMETADKRHESHWSGVLGNFFGQLGEIEKGENLLKKALSISHSIGYGRGITMQSEWLSNIFVVRMQNSFSKHDYNNALKILDEYQDLVDEMDNEILSSFININGYRSLLNEKRGTQNAINGKLEDAISDYGECLKLNPQNLEAALSRAEVQIWMGKTSDARKSLDSIYNNLRTTANEIIYAWLMCHIQNIENKPFFEFSKIIEENSSGNVQLNYDVNGIENYFIKTYKAKLTDIQILNFDVIQKLIKKVG